MAEPRAPRIRDAATRPDSVATLLKRHDADDIEELQGASFVGYLPLRKSTTSDRLFLFVEDLKWFAMRMPDEDLIRKCCFGGLKYVAKKARISLT